jgi:hypothetical protein
VRHVVVLRAPPQPPRRQGASLWLHGPYRLPSLPGVRLVTRTIPAVTRTTPAVINRCLVTIRRNLGLLTPLPGVAQIGYVDHTGCYRLVF